VLGGRTATKAPPASGIGTRRRDIQGLRALAVVFILAFHAGLPVPGGFVGVDVFFVISGFVITAMLLRELDATGGIDLVGFYSRRARRLLPALGVVVVAVAIAAAVVLSPLGAQRRTAKTGIATSLFSANVALLGTRTGYFDPPAEGNPLIHTWSLAVEEQLYLVFPVFLYAGWRLARHRVRRLSSRRALALVLSVACAGSFVISVVLTRHSAKAARVAFYAMPARAWEFGAGALLALSIPVLMRLHRTIAIIAGIGGIALLALATQLLDPSSAFPGPSALLPVLGAALVLISGTPTTVGVPRILGTPVLVRLGDVSYGWYLWHWPAIVFTRALWPQANAWALTCVALLAILPAWISYNLLEQPFRVARSMVGWPAFRMAVVALTVPATACAALLVSAQIAVSTTAIERRQAYLSPHAGGPPCDGPPVGQTGPGCTWKAVEGRGQVLLIGDSNAAQFSEPAASAANRQSLDLTLATISECPFVDLVVGYAHAFHGARCRTFFSRSLAAIREARPELVVIASSSSNYFNFRHKYRFESPYTGERATTADALAPLWEEGLASVLRQLHEAGIPAVVIHTVPHFPHFSLLECPAYRMYLDDGACATSLTRQEVAVQQREALASEARAVAAVPGAVGVDFTADLCDAERCPTKRGDVWLYKDSAHLSVQGAVSLTARFDELIQRNAR
jgi:peptidoglycan/LPS O-acetylase OafA/YrhL